MGATFAHHRAIGLEVLAFQMLERNALAVRMRIDRNPRNCFVRRGHAHPHKQWIGQPRCRGHDYVILKTHTFWLQGFPGGPMVHPIIWDLSKVVCCPRLHKKCRSRLRLLWEAPRHAPLWAT